MNKNKVFDSEYRLCCILWDNEPIKSAKLAEICREKLGWSKTTTYTVIKRLSDRGIVKNENTVVTSLVSREEVQSNDIDELVESRFDGSVPSFIAAFARGHRLTEKDIREIYEIINR